MSVTKTLPKLKPLAAVIALSAAQQAWGACTTESVIASLAQYDAAVDLLSDEDCADQTVTWNLSPGLVLDNPQSLSFDEGSLVINGSAESPATINLDTYWLRPSNETQSLTIRNVIVDGESGGSNIHMITAPGPTVIFNSTFKNARHRVIESDSDSLHIEGSHFLNNAPTRIESVIYHENGDSVVIKNSTFSGNTATRGGAITFMQTVDVSIEDSIFEDNVANEEGGAISFYTESNNEPLTISNSTFKGNSAGTMGGAIYLENYADVEITDSVFESNDASENGGALWVSHSSQLTIVGSTLEDNAATLSGGGIYIGQSWLTPATTVPVTFSQTSFVDNTTGAKGGAVYVDSETIESGTLPSTHLNIRQSLFSNNSAVSSSGALYVDHGNITQIENVTFDGNTSENLASTYANWGPVFDGSYVRHSTFTDNNIVGVEATSNSVIQFDYNDYSEFEISHTIIADNDFGDAAVRATESSFGAALTHSLLDDQTNTYEEAYILDNSNLLGGDGNAVLDAKLHPLADNGGPTLTRYPMDDSPVIDAGNAGLVGAPSEDQRSSVRELGTVDIGAVEYKNLPPELIRSTWTVESGTSFEFNVTDYIQDPDNHSLTVTVTENPIWMTFSPNGLSASGTVGAEGSYSLSVTVNDGNGFSLSATILITVTEKTADSNPDSEKSNKKKGGSFGYLSGLLLSFLLVRRKSSQRA